MGNKSSFRVDYDNLNKSCEQIAQLSNGASMCAAKAHARQRSVAAKTCRRHAARRFPEDFEDPVQPDQQVGSVRAQSMTSLQKSEDSPPRERRKTISQPIRIPLRRYSLTVENVQNSESFASPGSSGTQLPRRTENETSSVKFELVKCDDIVIHCDPGASTDGMGNRQMHHLYADDRVQKRRIGSAPPDFMTDFNPRQGEKSSLRSRNYSTGFDDHLLPPSTGHGFFPRPKRGQSLISFLRTVHFSSSNLELERENAHFAICQGVICAIEQRKWMIQLKSLRKNESRQLDDSFRSDSSASLVSAGTEISDDSSDLSGRSLDSELMSVSTTNLSAVVPGVAVEWREYNSAEEVGLSLLAKFTEQSLPKASDIHWMVSDQVNASYSGSSGWGSCEDGGMSGDISAKISFCRGTNEWAPPRAQIIFTRPRKGFLIGRKKSLQEQNYRCQGCGSRVSMEYRYSSKFRLCGYTGKYYCTGCHRNQVAVIPARVLDDWNFKLYPVTVFAYHLLEEIWYSPLFDIATVNPSLFDRIPALSNARKDRESLRYAKDHIMACRFYAQEEKSIFQNVPDYFTAELDLWSMADLTAVKRGGFQQYVQTFIQQCEDHVKQCELCRARGHLCEECHSVVFPWQTRVLRCPECWACIHKSCWTGTCPKCSRIRYRK